MHNTIQQKYYKIKVKFCFLFCKYYLQIVMTNAMNT